MIKVRVPATTANMGPGFDVIGTALDLYNTFTFTLDGDDVDRGSMIYAAAKVVFDKANRSMDAFTYEVDADIPIARGLGSSATCIVGGMVGANALLDYPFNEEEILKMASDFEGHPDNVAPALLGGCVVSISEDDKIIYRKVKHIDAISTIAAFPDFDLSTAEARAVLPKQLSYEDAIANIGRMALLIHGLDTCDTEAIFMGLKDIIHEPYRSELIDGYKEMKAIEDRYPGKMVISGAGPTLLFVTEKSEDLEVIRDSWKKISEPLEAEWDIRILHTTDRGAEIIESH
ncbi:MAG: homoserine kinase [Peptoniphilus sp.]|nr:homoserine kinase [Peptoniphilus sp.]MDD7362765.1 homoserine kinase [Bacillota bacterium]MDY6044541.1 homoserine kinase [Peptoniphilus sp.]